MTRGVDYYRTLFKMIQLKPAAFELSCRALSPSPFMKKIIALALAAICSVAGALSAPATTVIPPDFDTLVSRAEIIFQGSVINAQSQWVGEGAQRHIVTYVTFKVEDSMKGAPGASYTIRMLGGTVDGKTMEVTDGPKFKVGDRDILFVEHNGTQFIPLVGIMYGRYKIERTEDGREIVATNSGVPVSAVSEIGKERSATTSSVQTAAMSPAQFRSAVSSRVGQSAAQKQQN